MRRKLLTPTLKKEQHVSISAHQTAPISDLSLTGEERGVDSNYISNILGIFMKFPPLVQTLWNRHKHLRTNTHTRTLTHTHTHSHTNSHTLTHTGRHTLTHTWCSQ